MFGKYRHKVISCLSSSCFLELSAIVSDVSRRCVVHVVLPVDFSLDFFDRFFGDLPILENLTQPVLITHPERTPVELPGRWELKGFKIGS